MTEGVYHGVEESLGRGTLAKLFFLQIKYYFSRNIKRTMPPMMIVASSLTSL